MLTAPESKRARLAILAAIVVAGFALRWIGVGAPWAGADFHSVFGGYGSGAFARTFAQNGFFEAGLMPYRWRVETVDGTFERFWYTHHPAGYSVLSGVALALFGVREWALQLPSLAFSLLSIVACYRLTRDLIDTSTALLAAALFAVLPMGVFYGVLTWAEVPIAWLHLLLVHAYAAWLRTGERRHLHRCVLYVFLGGMLDWPAHFLLPALGLHLVVLSWRERDWRRTKAFVPLGIAAVVPILLHWIHLRTVRPHTLADMETGHTLSWVTRLHGVTLPQFLGFQVDFLVLYFTVPVLALCVVGLVRDALGRAPVHERFERGLIPSLLLPPLLYVGLFPARSTNHDFFWYLALPWVSITAAREALLLLRQVARLAERARPLVSGVGLLALGGLLVSCALQGRALWQRQQAGLTPLPVESAWLAPIVNDPETVVVTTSGRSMLLSFYSAAPIVGPIDSVAKLGSLRESLLSRVPPGRPVLFVFDTFWEAYFGQLREFLAEHADSVTAGPDPSPHDFVVYDITGWVHSPGPE